MFRFISKLLIFVSPILLMLGFVEHRLRAIPSGYRTKRAYLERHIGSVQVLITGSSHAYRGINPQLLGAPAFSIAYDNQDIYYDTRILLKYLPQAQDAKLVIVPISYFSFNGSLEDYNETLVLTSYYHRFWGIQHASPAVRIEDYSLIALYGIPRTRDFLWKGLPVSPPQQIQEDGFAEAKAKNVAAVLDAQAIVERQSRGLGAKKVRQVREYLEQLFATLQAKGIKAVIITTPCFHTYYDILRLENYRVMQEEIQTLCQEFGLHYHNYLTDTRFTIEDFADSDHLNANGAKRFSQILRDEVVREYIK